MATVLVGSDGLATSISWLTLSSPDSGCSSLRRACLGGENASRSEFRFMIQAAVSQRPEPTRARAYPIVNREGPICSISGRPTALNALLAKSTAARVVSGRMRPVSYTHLRAHETPEHLVCR